MKTQLLNSSLQWLSLQTTGGAGEPTRGRLFSLKKWRWLTLGVALVAIGLVLRIGIIGQLPLHLDNWLPWLNPPTVTLYFPDDQGRFLIPVTRQVVAEDVTPFGAVSELLKGPQDRARLRQLFPQNAHLSNLRIQDGVAGVEVMSESPDSEAVASAPLILEALTRTLRSFQGVESVRLVANGTLVSEVPVPAAAGYPVYYTYGSYLVPVATEASSHEEALHKYLAGPDTDSGLKALPDDVSLLEYRFDDNRGLAYINFSYTDSVRQLALDDPAGIRRILIGIIATLTAFPEVDAVMLNFEGHTRLGLGQCADLLRAPQVRPRVLNEEATVNGS